MRAAALTFLLLACSAAASTPTPPGYVLTGMPLVHQSFNACGPASISQVLAYFGRNVSMADVSRYTRASDRSYMSAQAIVTFAPLVGMEARLYRGGSLDTVRAAIRRGLPLIALQSHVSAQGHVIPHWRVIVGYDDARQQAYLMDPLLGYVRMGYADFKRVWADQGGQFAMLYPPPLGPLVRQAIG